MMRSLNAGVSGMRNHQVSMDVVANNIANVNTTAYKAGRVTFQEALVQTTRGSTRPTSGRGGINPLQIGLGMKVSSIDTNFNQGFLENTGMLTDLGIQGEGFFIVRAGMNNFYTRAGNFVFDANGRLVSGINGSIVQGIMADSTGNILANGNIEDIQISRDLRSAATATSDMSVIGNLDATLAVGDTAAFQLSVYDSLGSSNVVTVTFTKTGANTWTWAATDPSGAAAGAGNATFNADGTLNTFDDGAGGTPQVTFTPASGANPVVIDLDANGVSTFAGLTQFASDTTVFGRAENGNPDGTLDSINIDANGVIFGAFSNGETMALAQVALAMFTNPTGLNREGDGMFQPSVNSGSPVFTQAGSNNDTTIVSGSLEMANVDLTQEFTKMITTQRGFQANARVISTSDEMLMEVANLKR